MNKTNKTANFHVWQVLGDICLVFWSFILAVSIYFCLTGHLLFYSHLWLCFIFMVIFLLGMLMMRMYDITTFFYIDRIIVNTAISTLLATMSLGTAIFMLKSEQSSRLIFIMFSLLSCVLVIAGRLISRVRRLLHIGNGYTHVVFIGDYPTLNKYNSYIQKTAMKVTVDQRIDFEDNILHATNEFSDLLIKLSVNEVVMLSSLDKDYSNYIRLVLDICEEIGVTCNVIMETYDLPISNHFVSSIGPYPVITYHSVSFDKIQLLIKSIMDVAGATFGLILCSPIMLLAAIAIRLESPGPILFKQKRAGLNGKPFYIYKFRSMYQDAEARKKDLLNLNKIKGGFMFKLDKDPRITKVGAFIRKTSIDELPQLINVLKRDMSLVGTRPPTMDEVEKYTLQHRRRISIMPGITGMWQVSGRSNIIDFEDVVSLDKKYIDEWSIGLDIRILLRTVTTLVSRRGAS